MDAQKSLKLGLQQILAEQEQGLLAVQESEKNFKLFTRKADEFVDKKEEKSKMKDLDDLIKQA